MTKRVSWWKSWEVLGAAVPLLIFLGMAIWLWDFGIDDAAISWRRSEAGP